MSPTAAMRVAATITLTPGTVISRVTSGHDNASTAISFSASAISASRNSTWRTAESTVSRSVMGNCCSASQRRPLTPNRSDTGGRSLRQRINTAWISFLGARARPNQLGATCQPAAHRAEALIRGPDAIELTGPQQLGQGPRIEAVGLGPRLADAGVARRDDDHPRHMRLKDPRDRPRIARHLQRDPVARVQALRKQFQRLGPRLDPARRAQPALGDDRHLAEVAVHVQRYRSHLVLLVVVDWEEPVGKRHRRIRARGATGQVAGAATKKPGLEAHRPKRPAQPAFSQKAPRPSRPT